MRVFVITVTMSLPYMASSVHAERTLVHEAVITAPIAEVWNAFTTSEGFESWAVAHAEIDLRVGGDMRTSYVAESNLNDEHTIINRILSYEPQRMLSIQNVRAPAAFENAELFQQTWSVIHFEPVGERLTRVRAVGMGYGDGPEWDEIYDKFNAGNAYTLQKLKEKFTDRAEVGDDERVLELLHQLVGGEWIHESTSPDGSIFRVRNVIERGPDGRSLISRGWLGDAEGMIDHGPTITWRAPQSEGGGIWYFSIDQHGGVSSGRITLLAPDTVQWDWNLTSLSGEDSHYLVEQRFIDQDHYHMRLLSVTPAGERQEFVAATFERVDEAPQRFRMLRRALGTHVQSESTRDATRSTSE